MNFKSTTLGSFDVAVVGAGICGLAHALAAARLGKSVVVVDRDAHAILQRGALVIARRPEARAVLEEFMATDMGAECRLLEPAAISSHGDGLRAADFAAALYSPHEIRVESREAIPRLAAFLEERYGVTFVRETVVHSATAERLETSRGSIAA